MIIPKIAVIGLTFLLLSCGQEQESSTKTKREIPGTTSIEESNEKLNDTAKLQGIWVHEKDTLAIVKIVDDHWVYQYQGQPITKADSFTVTILNKLPEYVDTTIKTSFIRLSNLSDTMYFEILGVNDALLSLMHYPTARKHLYTK